MPHGLQTDFPNLTVTHTQDFCRELCLSTWVFYLWTSNDQGGVLKIISQVYNVVNTVQCGTGGQQDRTLGCTARGLGRGPIPGSLPSVNEV